MRCWSWRGPGGVAHESRPGGHTCNDHADEEEQIVLVLERLRSLARDLGGLAVPSAPNLDVYKELAERPTRKSFECFVPPHEAAVAVGFSITGGRQRDLVVGDASLGSLSDQQVLLHEEGGELYAHAEIKFSAKGHNSALKEMLLEDLQRVQNTLASASQNQWPYKPWTGLVLLGQAWAGAHALVIGTLHEYYHQSPVRRVQAALGKWWPIVDSIILPGCWLKLHELHIAPDGQSEPYPLFGAFLSSADDEESTLRPLALAAALMRHSMRYRKGLSGKGEALQVREYGAFAGPAGDMPINVHSGRRVGFFAAAHPPRVLYQADLSITLPWEADPSLRCSLGRSVSYSVSKAEEEHLRLAVTGKELEEL